MKIYFRCSGVLRLIVLARRDGGSYIDAMASRPCKPDADLKRLWRTLLGTPFPACGMPEDFDATNGDGIELNEGSRNSAEPIAKARAAEA
jgi:hypothetical protein